MSASSCSLLTRKQPRAKQGSSVNPVHLAVTTKLNHQIPAQNNSGDADSRTASLNFSSTSLWLHLLLTCAKWQTVKKKAGKITNSHPKVTMNIHYKGLSGCSYTQAVEKTTSSTPWNINTCTNLLNDCSVHSTANYAFEENLSGKCRVCVCVFVGRSDSTAAFIPPLSSPLTFRDRWDEREWWLALPNAARRRTSVLTKQPGSTDASPQSHSSLHNEGASTGWKMCTCGASASSERRFDDNAPMLITTDFSQELGMLVGCKHRAKFGKDPWISIKVLRQFESGYSSGLFFFNH